MQAAMTIVRVRSWVVYTWLHTTVDPSEREWDSCMSKVIASKDEVKGDISRIRSLVVSDGGAPTAKQRTQLFNQVLAGGCAAAVITNSLNNPVKRGIAIALSWLNPAFRAFTPAESADGFAHIGCGGYSERNELWHALLQLQLQLPAVRSLEQIARTLGLPSPVVHESARSNK